MNTTVNELKELYESLGGTPSDVAGITTIPDMIAALAEVAGTTIELPAVSSTDNGDVLTVVSGKWAKADPPKELPASATAGQVLTYNDGAWGAANVPTELPTSATSGQVLTYNGSAWGAANPSAETAVLELNTTVDFLTPTESAVIPTAQDGAIDAFMSAVDAGKVGFVKVTTSAATLGPSYIVLLCCGKTTGGNYEACGIITNVSPAAPSIYYAQVILWGVGAAKSASLQIKAAS